MSKNRTRTKEFFKKFGFYILAGVLAIAIILTLSLTLTKKKPTVDEPLDVGPTVDVTTTQPIVFGTPLEGATILKGYSATEMMYNETLKQWESHKAVDLVSESSKKAVACLDGTVTKVDKSYAKGTVVEITHASGFVSTYSSLASTSLKVGDKVKKGQAIGEISSSAANESAQMEHLHFVLKKDGVVVDPSTYLDLGGK